MTKFERNIQITKIVLGVIALGIILFNSWILWKIYLLLIFIKEYAIM